jgi:hypothetical protein
MGLKINENLNTRNYGDTIVFLPKGEECFIINGIAYDLYIGVSNNLSVDCIKKRLGEQYRHYSEKEIDAEVNNLVNEMLNNSVLIEVD